MNKLFSILSFFFVFNFATFAQEDINNYKYIIVPQRFDFLNEADQYQMNSLTKFLFNKYGFLAFIENEELPDDLKTNRCLALTAAVDKLKGGLLKTKLQINLLDCNNNLIAASKIGETREKVYKTAYNLALREAFETFQHFDYEYQPKKEDISENMESNSASQEAEKALSKKLDAIKAAQEADSTAAIKAQEEIKRLKQEVEALKDHKKVVEKTNSKLLKPEVVEDKSKKVTVNSPEEEIDLLYAQPIENGFQVVDTTPKVIMILMETSMQNVFMVKDKNEIVYKEDGFWYLSKNDGKTISVEPLNIKF